jgi:hypothetical protein
MIKAEPKSILHFIWTYFEIIKELFDTQVKDQIIRREVFAIILEKHNKSIESQLKEYKIVRQVNGDYELRDVYYKMIEFLLMEFRPLLPEEIEKFGNSISELFRKIKEGLKQDKNILIERIKGLSTQVKEFSEAIEKNSIRLLSETRELKSNVNRIGYKEKIQKASFWIQYYIIPINTILDVNHSESISNKLLAVSEFVNQRRLNFDEENIRLLFEQLYVQLIQTNDELLRQSKILTNELLPLIERIKTESQILTGWIEFLKNPYKATPPNLFKTDRNNPYSEKIYLNTKEYFEQFISDDDAVIDEEEVPEERWVFRKSLYKKKLLKSLPVKNFFIWCQNEFANDSTGMTNEKVFAIAGLLFEEDLHVDFSEMQKPIQIKTATSVLTVPILTITKNGVS